MPSSNAVSAMETVCMCASRSTTCATGALRTGICLCAFLFFFLVRFSCIVGACPTTVRSQDVGTHPRGESLEVRCNLVMEEEVPGLVLEMQSRRNTVALCVVTDHVQKHVHQERGVAGHLRKT